MNKLKFLMFIPILAFMMLACAAPVEVPPAHVGKLSTDSGLQEGIIQPSKLKLEGMCRSCDNLILAEASDFPATEKMVIFMPQDNLNLTVEVKGVFAITSDETNMNRVFSRVTAEPTDHKRVMLVPISKVYNTYAQNVIQKTTRSVITQYSIDHVMENRAAISEELTLAVLDRLKTTPIKPIEFGLADVQPPAIVVRAQEEAKQRRIDIQKARAEKEILIERANANLEVARTQQAADLVEAETQVLVNKKLAESVSDAFITQRTLKFMQTIAENDSKTLVIPWEAMQTFGAQSRIWNFGAEGD